MSGDVGTEREMWLAILEQRRIDATPCPKCGGDRLRQDFAGPGRCHVALRTEREVEGR